METIKGYSKENVFREARKLVDTLNRFGNCLVPSIHDDKSDTTAQERLEWLVNSAKEKFSISLEDIEVGIDALFFTQKPSLDSGIWNESKKY